MDHTIYNPASNELYSTKGELLFRGNSHSCVVNSKPFWDQLFKEKPNIDLHNAYFGCKFNVTYRSLNLNNLNLSNADLSGCTFVETDFSGSDLSYADLSNSSFKYCKFRGANLSKANMSDSYFISCNFEGVDLTEAILMNAQFPSFITPLYGVKNIDQVIARTRIVPPLGQAFTAWKKCGHSKIVELLIPAEAERSHAFGIKCRAAYANVINITDFNGEPCKIATSLWDVTFRYYVGQVARPDRPFDTNWQRECAPGIHFFMHRHEAEAFIF